MKKERPIVVTILAGILFFVGGLDILLGLRFGANYLGTWLWPS